MPLFTPGSTITISAVIRFLVGLLLAAIAVWLVWYFSDVVIYILVSAVLAIMFRPMANYLSKLNIRGRSVGRSLSALVTLLCIWLLFALIFSLFFPLIGSKINQFANMDFGVVLSSVEEPVMALQRYLQDTLSISASEFSLQQSLLESVREFADFSHFNAAFSSIVSLAATLVISFFSISFITFFFLKDDSLFYEMMTSLFPSRYSSNIVRALDSISYLLSRYFVGLMCESAIIGSAVSVVMICMGMSPSDAFFIDLVMGVLNVIPYAGPFIGACISLFLGVLTPIEALGVGDTVVTIVVTLMVVKGLDDFLLQPTLYSERVKAHPLEVFIVILLSGYVAGVVGMLLAIPSYTVLRVFAKEFFSQFSLVRKLTKEL